MQHYKDQQRINDKHSEWYEEEKNVVDEALRIADVSLHEEIKYIDSQVALLELFRSRLLFELPDLFEFIHFKIVKFSRAFQLAFYLSGIDHNEIVEPKTNMISWKKAKKFLNHQFKEFISGLHPKGPKPNNVPVYAKTMRLEKELKALNYEDIQNYSLALSMLYKFLEQYFKVRILDVKFRRHEFNSKVEEREQAIKTAEELEERRKNYLREAIENHEKELEGLEEDAEKPAFDEAKILQEFDETGSNKPIDIPPEIIPDQDGDIDWEEIP